MLIPLSKLMSERIGELRMRAAGMQVKAEDRCRMVKIFILTKLQQGRWQAFIMGRRFVGK